MLAIVYGLNRKAWLIAPIHGHGQR
jgi:hypothetical protein